MDDPAVKVELLAGLVMLTFGEVLAAATVRAIAADVVEAPPLSVAFAVSE